MIKRIRIRIERMMFKERTVFIGIFFLFLSFMVVVAKKIPKLCGEVCLIVYSCPSLFSEAQFMKI